MNGITLMMEEHQLILKAAKALEAMTLRLYKKQAVEVEDFLQVVDFIRNFADKHHHMKEEHKLFTRLLEQFGDDVQGTIHGMEAEHVFGRYMTGQMEEAAKEILKGNKEREIDLVTFGRSYVDLIRRHIDREDKALFPFSDKNLTEDRLTGFHEDCKIIEQEARDLGVQENYKMMVDTLTSKYVKESL